MGKIAILKKIIISIVVAYIAFGLIYNLVTIFSRRVPHPDFLEAPRCEPFFGCEE